MKKLFKLLLILTIICAIFMTACNLNDIEPAKDPAEPGIENQDPDPQPDPIDFKSKLKNLLNNYMASGTFQLNKDSTNIIIYPTNEEEIETTKTEVKVKKTTSDLTGLVSQQIFKDNETFSEYEKQSSFENGIIYLEHDWMFGTYSQFISQYYGGELKEFIKYIDKVTFENNTYTVELNTDSLKKLTKDYIIYILSDSIDIKDLELNINASLNKRIFNVKMQNNRIEKIEYDIETTGLIDLTDDFLERLILSQIGSGKSKEVIKEELGGNAGARIDLSFKSIINIKYDDVDVIIDKTNPNYGSDWLLESSFNYIMNQDGLQKYINNTDVYTFRDKNSEYKDTILKNCEYAVSKNENLFVLKNYVSDSNEDFYYLYNTGEILDPAEYWEELCNDIKNLYFNYSINFENYNYVYNLIDDTIEIKSVLGYNEKFKIFISYNTDNMDKIIVTYFKDNLDIKIEYSAYASKIDLSEFNRTDLNLQEFEHLWELTRFEK